MNLDQLTSLVRSILKVVGGALVAHGMTQAAGIVNGEDLAGVVIAVVGLAWSHWENRTVTPPATSNAQQPTSNIQSPGSKTLPVWFIIGGLVAFLGMLGCASQQRVAANTIFSVEQSADAAWDGYCALVIKGVIPTNSVPAVKLRFAQVQAGCLLAATVGQNGTNALAPAELTAELANLTGFIASLQKPGN